MIGFQQNRKVRNILGTIPMQINMLDLNDNNKGEYV